MPTAPKAYRPPHAGTARQQEKSWQSRRDPKRAVYQSSAWRSLREAVFIRDGGRCVKCGAFLNLHARRGSNDMVMVCDHVQPATTPESVLCEMNNLQSLCPKCANEKTAGRDGGFGNERK